MGSGRWVPAFRAVPLRVPAASGCSGMRFRSGVLAVPELGRLLAGSGKVPGVGVPAGFRGPTRFGAVPDGFHPVPAQVVVGGFRYGFRQVPVRVTRILCLPPNCLVPFSKLCCALILSHCKKYEP